MWRDVDVGMWMVRWVCVGVVRIVARRDVARGVVRGVVDVRGVVMGGEVGEGCE